LRITI